MHFGVRDPKKKQQHPRSMLMLDCTTNNNNNDNISFQSSRYFHGMLINPFEVFINFHKWEPLIIYQSKKWQMRIQSFQYFLHELNIISFLLFLIYFTPSSHSNEWALDGPFFLLIFHEFVFDSTFDIYKIIKVQNYYE